MKQENDRRVSMLVTFLSQVNQSRRSWVSRKEVAAWSAALLYCAVLLTFANLAATPTVLPSVLTSTILLGLLWAGFCFFIHTQIGSCACEVARQIVLNRWQLWIISRQDFPPEFSVTPHKGQDLPNEIEAEIKRETRLIRSGCIIKRFVFLFLRRPKKHSLQVQEFTIYMLMLVLSVAVLLLRNRA